MSGLGLMLSFDFTLMPGLLTMTSFSVNMLLGTCHFMMLGLRGGFMDLASGPSPPVDH
jgi:hypothetical protein